MHRHSVTVTTTLTRGGFLASRSHCATCDTCGWRGDRLDRRDQAEAQAHRHRATNPVVSDPATQAIADEAGEAAEWRYLGATSSRAARAAARTEARGRIEAALGNPEHQEALDAEIDRHLAARRHPPTPSQPAKVSG